MTSFAPPDAPPHWLEPAIQRLWANESLSDFCAWFARQELGEQPPASAAEADWLRRARLSLARVFWSHMPVPANRWRARPLPHPARNDPCHCGSARKYKQCCQEFANLKPPIDETGMLTMALSQASPDLLDPQQLHQLPPEALGEAALNWNDDGRAEDTLRVLEPLFLQHLGRLNARHELALDAVLDALLKLHQERRRRDLARHVSTSPVLQLATTARARLITILCDNGDYPGAWALFETARRLAPKDPQLWSLEMTLLLSEGRSDEARLRGPLLAAQARKSGHPELAEALIELAREGLHAVAESLSETLASEPGAQAWLAIARALPEQTAGEDWQALYADTRESAGPPPATGKRPLETPAAERTATLQPLKALTDIERRWHRRWPVSKPDLTALWSENADHLLEDRQGVLQFLREHPKAWLSFDILDDLLLASSDWRDARLPAQLLQASQRVLDHAIAGLRALLGPGHAELPWLVMGNRPALRLLAQAIELARLRHDVAGEEALLHWGLALNPHDNHGWRHLLTPLLLEQSRFAQALELFARYPDDFPPSEHLRALALFALGRKTEAETVLRAAHVAYPRIMDALWPDVLDPPRSDSSFGMTLGSAEEAYHYRLETRALWLRSGALAWARTLGLPPAPPEKKAAPARAADPAKARHPLQGVRTPVFSKAHEQHLRQHFDYPRLHGLITAVVWTPQLMMANRWLDAVMALRRGDAPEPDIDALQHTLDIVMRLYNRLNLELLRTPPAKRAPLTALGKLLEQEPADVFTWAAGFVEGAELARGAWRGAKRPIKSDDGAFGALHRLAAQAAPGPGGWRASNEQEQPLLVGIEAAAPAPKVMLTQALEDLWQVVGPIRHARLAGG